MTTLRCLLILMVFHIATAVAANPAYIPIKDIYANKMKVRTFDSKGEPDEPVEKEAIISADKPVFVTGYWPNKGLVLIRTYDQSAYFVEETAITPADSQSWEELTLMRGEKIICLRNTYASRNTLSGQDRQGGLRGLTSNPCPQ